MDDNKKRMNKKEREKDIRNDGFKRTSGVKYDSISDRQMGDKRFERERSHKISVQEKGASALKESGPSISSTFDAFQRMAAGLEGRTIADKISDPNRPTWEQYKKENEEKLDLVGNDVRKMVEYRAQLDRDRDERLQRGTKLEKKKDTSSDSDESSQSSNEDDEIRSKKRHRKDKRKDKKSNTANRKHKAKKERKSHKKQKRINSDDEEKAPQHDKDRGPMRLSDFMRPDYDSS